MGERCDREARRGLSTPLELRRRVRPRLDAFRRSGLRPPAGNAAANARARSAASAALRHKRYNPRDVRRRQPQRKRHTSAAAAPGRHEGTPRGRGVAETHRRRVDDPRAPSQSSTGRSARRARRRYPRPRTGREPNRVVPSTTHVLRAQREAGVFTANILAKFEIPDRPGTAAGHELGGQDEDPDELARRRRRRGGGARG